ncbi:MAG: ATP-dependent RecD-like DNA helicase [Bacilli bacterium]
MEIVYGAVVRVTYYDEEKGFGIVKIKLDYKDSDMAKYKTTLFSNVLTVLSSFDRKPMIEEEFEFSGEFEVSSYGPQFKAKTFSRRNEQSKEGIITYLSSDYFPGIGQVAATKIFDVLGKTCLKDIVHDRNLLDQVDLSTKQKAVLYDGLVENYQNEQELVNLLNLGISMKIAIRITRSLPENAYQLICENPYQLIDLIDGIGFARADGIAMQIGILKNSPLRLKAAMLFVLKNAVFSTGNTYIKPDDWYQSAIHFTNQETEVLTKDIFEDLKLSLLKEQKIIQDSQRDIYLIKIYYDEVKLATRLRIFLNNDCREFDAPQVEKELNQTMIKNRIEYNPKQYEAIKTALLEPISIITGGPGTGKSTIIKGIIDTYSALFPHADIVKESIKLVAPTGRAAKRLCEVTHHQATTIHKLLEYDGGDVFFVTPDAPIDAKMIIIDEFSMVDISLASLLLNCILPTTKVVIVGDSDQLPSVGPGNVLYDCIVSKEITTVRLDKIHRQANDSTIIDLAHHINHGEVPLDLFALQDDRTFIQVDDLHLIRMIEQTIHQAMDKGFDLIFDIQVLVPLYRGDVGIDAINYHLQDRFNPSIEQVNHLSRRFRVNDKVIQLVNRQDKQVMNGDIGSILSLEFEQEKFKRLTVMFDFGPVIYEAEELEDLSLAYAVSIHKAQGSEFPVVIMPFSFKYYIMLKRKLIYTGITRAKKYLILIGSKDAFSRGVIQVEDPRQTKLCQRLKEALNSPFEPNYKQETTSNMESMKPEDFM